MGRPGGSCTPRLRRGAAPVFREACFAGRSGGGTGEPGTLRGAVQFSSNPTSRATFWPISLSRGKDSIPITEYPSSHGIR